jgi:hypothetical protein
MEIIRCGILVIVITFPRESVTFIGLAAKQLNKQSHIMNNNKKRIEIPRAKS